MLTEALQLLPSGITRLELQSYCVAAVPDALARVTRLQQLDIPGNAYEIDWSTPAAASLIPLLRCLRLSLIFGDDTPPAFTGGVVRIYYSLPSSDAAALAAASCMERLVLQCQRWSEETGQLLQALPALVDLRWALREGWEEGCGSLRASFAACIVPAVSTAWARVAHYCLQGILHRSPSPPLLLHTLQLGAVPRQR